MLEQRVSERNATRRTRALELLQPFSELILRALRERVRRLRKRCDHHAALVEQRERVLFPRACVRQRACVRFEPLVLRAVLPRVQRALTARERRETERIEQVVPVAL